MYDKFSHKQININGRFEISLAKLHVSTFMIHILIGQYFIDYHIEKIAPNVLDMFRGDK